MRQTGFTLIEAMIVIALISIILSIAAPSLRNMMQDSRLASASEEMLTSMMLARTEAIKRNARVMLCNSSDPAATSASCVTSSPDWKTGWLVFVDKDADNTFSTGDEILRVVNVVEKVGSIAPSDTTLTNVRFRSVLNQASKDVSFTFCTSGQRSRVVTLDKTSRVNRTIGSACT
ncbi:GspH/FimT family pseudopilin [Chitinolyticbacter meiyuanensis]|uniref:GspH/FimT family pseudopilin n=1 Tax=Chitinolyticbacter meiyuanensis TaxID=682798 RepID=UPI0011E5DB45|nr:GspH/FimT family pseudopilin [Chitinolyticbacter meiyuanensis]